MRFVLSFCLFVFPLMGKAEWGGNPVCWWFGLFVYFVCCLEVTSCTEWYWWLDKARSCVTVVSIVWVFAIWYSLAFQFGASLAAQRIKHLPAMWETRVRSLGWEEPLEKEMATHSSTFAWRIPWTEDPGGLRSTGLQRFGHNWATSLYCTVTVAFQFRILRVLKMIDKNVFNQRQHIVLWVGCKKKRFKGIFWYW